MAEIKVAVDSVELNEWVHEKVMGYTRDFLKADTPNIQVWIGETPDYCGSLDNAFLVVDKMRERGWLIAINNTPEGAWCLSVMEWVPAENGWATVAAVKNEALPRAICEAAAAVVASRA